MAGTRNVLLTRIFHFGYLLQLNPTPLLLEELHRAIILHLNAYDSADVNPLIPDLNTSHSRIEEHWARLYSDMLTRASLQWDMDMFEQFLSSKLLEDYSNQPFKVLGRMLKLAECTTKQDKEYQDHVVLPLEESMLDREYVENKLRAVAARKGRPGNDIQQLIDACDWPRLAEALTNDRDIILRLARRSACSKETSKRILAGIDRVQNKHFASLSSSSEFTLAPAGHQPSPFLRVAGGVFDAIASSIKGDTPSSNVNKSPDELRPLLGRDNLTQDLPLSISAVNLKKLE